MNSSEKLGYYFLDFDGAGSDNPVFADPGPLLQVENVGSGDGLV
jgi:hypothetical protein